MAGKWCNCNRASLLLAVQPTGASYPRMMMIPVLALMLAPSPPLPLTELQMRDIGCVATMALVVAEMPDLAKPAKRWSGIVGQRVMDESGQPREVVAAAMIESANAQAARGGDGAARQLRIAQCQAIMAAELAATDAASTPLPRPVKSQ